MTSSSYGVSALVAVLALALIAASPLRAATPPDAAIEYFSLEPGTPTQEGTSFGMPVFVIGEPAGSAANLSEVRQAWQNLQVVYLADDPSVLGNWSVSSWGEGNFDLQIVLSSTEVASIEEGDALLALNSSVVIDGSTFGAAGLIDGAVLSSSVVVGAWWSTVFGIQTPPPDPTLSSLQGIISDLAWFGSSTAGRAAYAVATIVAILLYLWEGHKLARAKLLGTPSKKEAS
ncbi:MAG: hypothetical protein ACRDV4_12465 [Acidimicrobiales bacterium]